MIFRLLSNHIDTIHSVVFSASKLTLRFLALAVGVICLWLMSLTGWAQETANDIIPDRPNPPRLVNDYAGMLQPGERQQLEQKLKAYNDSTSTQIAIIIVKTTQPYPIGDFAFQVGRKWGVGQKGKSNGLVLAWAPGDRKIYIATGYGLEGAIPDAVANRIVDNIIVPAFKEQRYYDGLDAATTEIIKRASGEYKAEPKSDDGDSTWIVFLVFAVILVFIIIGMRNRGGGNRYRGGGGGPIFFPPTTYSGWGSSSSGGGDSGGGSFGGFGGGSFGGGGAGGDY